MKNNLLLIVNISLLYLCWSKANKTDEPSKREKPVIENLAEFYINSAIYGETKAELDQLPVAQKNKGTSTVKEPVYVTSFCHQLRWIARRSFKNLLGNPQASVAQVMSQMPDVLRNIHEEELASWWVFSFFYYYYICFRILFTFYLSFYNFLSSPLYLC